MRRACRARDWIGKLVGSARNAYHNENSPIQLRMIADLFDDSALGMNGSISISTAAGARPQMIRCHFYYFSMFHHNGNMDIAKLCPHPYIFHRPICMKKMINGLLVNAHILLWMGNVRYYITYLQFLYLLFLVILFIGWWNNNDVNGWFRWKRCWKRRWFRYSWKRS